MTRMARMVRMTLMNRFLATSAAAMSVAFSLALADAALSELHAQARPDAACTYDTCALRIRAASFIEPPMLVRGAAGTDVAPLTPFGEPLAPYFAGADSAYAQALRYDRISPTAGVLNIAGPAILVIGPMLTNWRERPIASFTLMAGGLGMTLYGTHLANTATDALNRAVWWYNRSWQE